MSQAGGILPLCGTPQCPPLNLCIAEPLPRSCHDNHPGRTGVDEVGDQGTQLGAGAVGGGRMSIEPQQFLVQALQGDSFRQGHVHHGQTPVVLGSLDGSAGDRPAVVAAGVGGRDCRLAQGWGALMTAAPRMWSAS